MARIAIDARKLRDFGIGTYLTNLLVGLERLDNDHEYVLLTSATSRPPVSSASFRSVRTAARNYGLLEHVSLPFAATRADVQLYHAPHYVLPWLTRGPAVVTIHDLIHLRFPQYLPGVGALQYARTMIRRSYRRATRVLTVSEATKQDLLEHFGGDPDRIDVVANSVPEAFLRERPEDDLERVRERWNLPRRYVLYTGNVKPHKNLERLMRAFARVRASPDGEEVHLVLLGSHSARYRPLHRLATELNLQDFVRFVSWLPQDDLAAVYRLAAAFVYPSLFEGFGLPPLEAMACGVAVVSSNASSLPEVCGDAAVYVEPTDIESIASGVLDVLTDDRLRKDLIRKGTARASTFLTAEQARRTVEVYDRALQQN